MNPFYVLSEKASNKCVDQFEIKTPIFIVHINMENLFKIYNTGIKTTGAKLSLDQWGEDHDERSGS